MCDVDDEGGEGGGGGGGEAARLQLLPSLTSAESASIQHYLDECGVAVADIHQLEATLQHRLGELERGNTRALFGAELAAADGVVRELQHVHESVLRMSKWMRHHDRGLHHMKVGIAAIESRNRLLDLQEKNHGILVHTLQQLLSELSLDASTTHTLLNARIAASSRAAYQDVVCAARQLHAMTRAHLHNGLEALAAVREKRAEIHQIRDKFCQHLLEFFTSEFAAVAARTSEKKRSTTAQALVSHERAHMSLSRFEELAGVLEMLAPDVFVALRRHYCSAFHEVYMEQYSGYFASLKKTMSREKKECNLSAPSEEESLSDRSLSSRTGRAFLKRATARASERDEDSSHSVHGKQLLVTEVFKDIIDNAVSVVMEEQDFCLSFFGLRQLESLKATDCSVVKESQLEADNRKEICAMLSSLFKGFDVDIRSLCDKAADLSSAYLVEILVRIEASLNEYSSEYSLFIHSMLESLRNHANELFQKFVREQIDWISTLKPSPKRCGVLLPIRRFPVWVERLHRAAVRANAPPAASATTSAALTGLESVYVQVSEGLMSWLQNVAKQDPKYTHVVLMENAHHFWSVMSTSLCSKGAGMSAMVAKAYDIYVDARDAYVQWNIGYALPEIIEFFDLLETQMKACTNPTDVPFMQGLSKHELRALLKAHIQQKKLKKRAQAILSRIQKHIGPSSPLLPTLWRCIRDSFVEKFQKFEELVSKCYHAEQVGMTVAELDSIFIRLSDDPEETSYTESSRASQALSPRR